jgi:glycosyltransferase involved in cell wall biosynthesis
MRIAYVCADAGVPVFGQKGSSVHVQEVVRAFTKRGIDVALFAARTGGLPPADLHAVRVHEIAISAPGGVGDRERTRVAANSRTRAALESNGPFDLVYERYSLWSTAGMEYARAKGLAGVLEVNAPLIDEQARYRNLIDRAGAERATQEAFCAASTVVVVSRAIVPYVEQYGGRRERVHVVPNGVDPARFPSHLEPSVRGSDDTFTVGFLGSLKPWHGVTSLVEAFARVHRDNRSTRLLVVGDGPERSSLIADVSARGLVAAVHVTGAVAPAQVPRLLASMDAGVAPYLDSADFYFSPLKIYEYMAAALPTVASDIGQIAEVIAHDVDGLLCRPGDWSTLAEALVRLQADPDLRTRLGAAARRKVIEHHSWDAVAGRVLDLAQVSTVAEARA